MRAINRFIFSALLSSLILTHTLFAQTSPITTGTLQANMFRIATIPTATQSEPIDLVTAPGDPANRLFVATHKGFIRLVKDNSLQPTPFLDLAARGYPIVGGTSSDERGLLGLAFSPNFYAPEGTPGRGKFYTYTSEAKGTNSADFFHPEIGATGGDHQSVIREWTVNLNNPDVADPAVAPRILMRIAEPQSNHNGGALRFGNDGMLYISLGDGGGGNDFSGSVTSTTDGHTSPNGNGQDTTNVYGKILRINPTGTNSVNGNYGVPSDNPFFGSLTAVNEIFAYGLRNPFRINFDRPTGKLYVGDVGQDMREEVDIVTSGGNFGWAYMEGTRVNTITGRTIPAGFTSIAPIAEYTHADGHSITGGFVYHGSVPEWQGKYIFGDYTGTGSAGRLFYMNQNGGTINQFNNALSGGFLYAFGEDADGELYAMMNTGAVDKLLATNAWNVDGGGSWGLAANWNGGIPASAIGARFLNSLSRGRTATITLDGDRTVASLTISNPNQYTIAPGTGGTLYIGSKDGIHVLRGSHTISAPVYLDGSPALVEVLTLEVRADSQLNITGSFTIGIGVVDKIGGGTFTLSNKMGGKGTITVREGQVRLDANTGSTANATTAADSYLSLVAGAPSAGVGNSLVTLNADQDLARLRSSFANSGLQGIDLHSPAGGFRSVRAYASPQTLSGEYTFLASAIANAITNAGDGIYDSRISGMNNMCIGIMQTADAHGDQHLLMRPTIIGDLNLDGSVSIADFIDLAAHFNQTSARWQDGDINYDGSVTIADFIALAANFNTNYAGEVLPIDPTEQNLLNDFYQSNVPEPAPLSLLLLAPLFFSRRPSHSDLNSDF